MFETLVVLADGVFDRFRARIGTLTDNEYFWEPVDDCWSIRSDGDQYRMEGEFTQPADAAPITTIAWRLAHIGGECLLGYAYREWPELVPDPRTVPVPGSARAAIDLCELGQRSWRDNFAALGPEGVLRPSRALRDTPYEGGDIAGVHLHVYDEVIHHGAEVGLLRDLYRSGFSETDR